MSAARDTILAFEQEKLEQSYDEALRRLTRMVRSPHYDVTDLICRVLTSRVLDKACGMLSKHGIRTWGEGPLSRMEWTVWFVGHEILDDGDPALAWHRNVTLERDNDDYYRDCDKDHPRALPYFHSCREITAEKFEDLAEMLTEDLVIWTLDWWEVKEDELYAMSSRLDDLLKRDREPEVRSPEDPLMVALAAELRALPKLTKEE